MRRLDTFPSEEFIVYSDYDSYDDSLDYPDHFIPKEYLGIQSDVGIVTKDNSVYLSFLDTSRDYESEFNVLVYLGKEGDEFTYKDSIDRKRPFYIRFIVIDDYIHVKVTEQSTDKYQLFSTDLTISEVTSSYNLDRTILRTKGYITYEDENTDDSETYLTTDYFISNGWSYNKGIFSKDGVEVRYHAEYRMYYIGEEAIFTVEELKNG